MLRCLIGGSPCTHWSIAQSKDRETLPQGIGWELFLNYLIAKERYRPDFFLYENNKSAAPAIKDSISAHLGAPLQYIDSALVSAQRRRRFYCHNFGDVPQPEDRGILLRDILESGQAWTDKSYALTTRCMGAIPKDTLKRHRHSMVAEPVGPARVLNINPSGKGMNGNVIGVDGKSTCLTTNKGEGQKIIEPVGLTPDGRTDKANTLRASAGTKQGNYNLLRHVESGGQFGYQGVIEFADGTTRPAYPVQNGLITIKGKQYPVKLCDGLYIIRKLTVTECCRLQTMPDDYCRAVSATQGYKGLGNGWTAEVIIHLLRHALRGVPKDTHIEVLSMYDGIGTGRYCFDRLGYRNITYYAYEIDKFAMQVAMSNYPGIIQCGDAFAVRGDDWGIGQMEIDLWQE